MIRWAILDDDGYPTVTQTDTLMPVGAVLTPSRVSVSDVFLLRFVDGLWQGRPVLDPWVVTSTDPMIITASNLPAGTTFEVWDAEIDFLLATLPEMSGIITFELEDVGAYRVRLLPPRPYLPETQYIEVTA